MPEPHRATQLRPGNRTVIVASLLLFAAAGTIAAVRRTAPVPQTVTAQKIVIVDALGHEHAVLTADTRGAMLTFQNSEGQARLRIGLLDDEAHVDTWDNVRKQWRNRAGGITVVPVR